MLCAVQGFAAVLPALRLHSSLLLGHRRDAKRASELCSGCKACLHAASSSFTAQHQQTNDPSRSAPTIKRRCGGEVFCGTCPTGQECLANGTCQPEREWPLCP